MGEVEAGSLRGPIMVEVTYRNPVSRHARRLVVMIKRMTTAVVLSSKRLGG